MSITRIRHFDCLVCGCTKVKSFWYHLRKKHNLSPKEYIDTFLGVKLCEVCGNEASFHEHNNAYLKTCGSACMKKLIGNKTKERLQIPYYKKLQKEIASLGGKTAWSDEAFRERKTKQLRQAAFKRFTDPNDNFGKMLHPVNYQGVVFRSKPEVICAKFLNEKNIKWEYEKYCFSYVRCCGSLGKYIPDFYLPFYNLFLEIKGTIYEDENTERKLAAVREQGHKTLLLLTGQKGFVEPLEEKLSCYLQN